MIEENYSRETLLVRDDGKVIEETIRKVKYMTNNYISDIDAIMNVPCFHNKFSLRVLI